MEAIDGPLCRAMLARTLKLGLRHPSRQSLQAFSCERGRRALRKAAETVEPGGGPVTEAVESFCERMAVLAPSMTSSYEAILGHASRGRVCPYETGYVAAGEAEETQVPPALRMADISGFYLSFGLEATEPDGERADHAACEFEFLEHLFMKEAGAVEQADMATLEITRQAIREFLRDHIGSFGPALGTALQREDPGGYLGAIGSLCTAFLRHECARLQVPPGPDLLDHRPIGGEGGTPPDRH